MNCEILRKAQGVSQIPSTAEDGLHQPLISHPETKVLLPLYLVIYFIHYLSKGFGEINYRSLSPPYV